MNAFLYITTVIIWGTTWIAINWQAGDVSALVSVLYRFVIAGALFLPVLWLLGRVQSVRWRDHGFFVLQGICLFCLNYIFMYHASYYIISGLMSVIFAMATLFNAFNQWLIWRKRPSPAIYLAGVMGIAGLVLLFWQQLRVSGDLQEMLYGTVLCLLGTYCFSLGNMVSVRNSQHHIDPATSNAYGMVYGAAILLVIVLMTGAEFTWDSRPAYWGSLLYLAIPGSIIGFTAYLMLVARIGANQAVYTSVLFPVVALSISTFLEGYQWDIFSVSGLALVMLGVLVSSRGDLLWSILRCFYRRREVSAGE